MLRFIIILSFIAFIGACKEKGGEQQKNVVIAHISQIPDQLRPVAIELEDKIHIFQFIHSFLLREDLTTNELVPQTLKSIPQYNAEENCYELELNENARFDDGSKITSNDIAFTIKALACQGVLNQKKGNFENYERIEVVNDQSLKFYITNRTVQDVVLLTDYPILQESVYDSASVVADFTFKQLYEQYDSLASDELKKWCDKMNGNYFGTFKKNLHGAGPYELTEWENDRIILTLKENHWTQLNDNWMDKSYAEQIVFKLKSDVTAKILDLKNELVSVSTDFGSKQIDELRNDTSVTNKYNLFLEPANGLVLLGFNLKPELSNRHPFFLDQKVREAFALGLPVQLAIDKLSNGKVLRVASFISINKDEYNNNLEPYKYDLDAAAELLKEAGWTDTDQDGILDKTIDGEKVDFELEIAFSPHPLFEAIASLFKASFQEIGVNLNFINGNDWRTKVEDERAFDLVFYSITNMSGHNHPYSLVLSEGFALGYNYAGYENQVVDSLIEKADETFNVEERKKALYKMQEILYRELPYVYIGTGKRGLLVHKKYGEVKTSGITPVVRLNTLKQKE
jgi:peptide/nickel transport system substrate-binding protein